MNKLPDLKLLCENETVATHHPELFKNVYLVKIDTTYKEVRVVSTNPSNTELVRVVDLEAEKFYWVYRKDLFTNVGDLK